MKKKIIEIIKTMRGHAAIDDALGEKRCSFYLNDYADQLANAIGYEAGNEEEMRKSHEDVLVHVR